MIISARDLRSESFGLGEGCFGQVPSSNPNSFSTIGDGALPPHPSFLKLDRRICPKMTAPRSEGARTATNDLKEICLTRDRLWQSSE